MKKRLNGAAWMLAAVLAVALAVPAAAALPQYAVAAGETGLYALGLGVDWSTGGYNLVEGITGTSFSGVAVRGDLVYVLDKAQKQLIVGRLKNFAGNPSVELLRTVQLQSGDLRVHNPTNLAVDPSGGVYVVGESYSDELGGLHNTYAYVQPIGGDWTQGPNVALHDMPDSPMSDVGAFSIGGTPGGIIAHKYFGADQDPNAFAGSTYVTKLAGGSTAGGQVHLGNDNRFPQCLAVLSTGGSHYAYIANQVADSIGQGSLSVVDPATMSKIGDTFILPDNFVPQDMIAFASGESNWLAISGATGASQSVLRYQIGASGQPIDGTGTLYRFSSSDISSMHYLGASPDGSIVWVTNQDSKSVIALDSSTWDPLTGGFFSQLPQGLGQIAGVEFPEPVPEPGSLAALAGMCLAFTARRRRR